MIKTGYYQSGLTGSHGRYWTPRYYTDSKLNRTIHSEINAILFADSDKLPGSTLYVTAPPCVRCAVQIIQCGIEKVVCYAPSPKMVERWGDQMALAQELFREAEVIYLEHAHE